MMSKRGSPDASGRYGSRLEGGKRGRTGAGVRGVRASSIDVDFVPLRVGNQEDPVRPQKGSNPPKCYLGWALGPQSDSRRRFLYWREGLRARNEYLAVGQGGVGERDEICQVVNLGCFYPFGSIKGHG